MTDHVARPFRSRSARVALAAAGATIVATAAVMAPAGAGAPPPPDPTASVDVSCRDGAGYFHVSIVDDFSTTYDVTIGGVVVGDNITDTDGGVNTYGPYADGEYFVQVEWILEDNFIFEGTLTIACAGAATTATSAPTTSTTTTAPPLQAAPTTTTTAAPAPIAVQPTYTG